MDRFITSYENISLWQISRASLPLIARFIVEENYEHHKDGVVELCDFTREYNDVLIEENAFFNYSSTIVAKNDKNQIVGVIRISKWNNNPHKLPLMKLFGDKIINTQSLIEEYHHLWHVGRFAIKQEAGNSITLFKLLMLYAISPVFGYSNGILLAETDAKLFRVMKALRIDAQQLSEGKEYIGSMTIPMMVTKNGLTEFMLNNLSLAFNISIGIEALQLPERVKIFESQKNYPFEYCKENRPPLTLQI